MRTERLASQESLLEVLDRVLDKGLVIDVALRASVSGIEILGVAAQVVIASIQTYEALASHAPERRRTGRPLRRRSAKPAVTTGAGPRQRRQIRDTVNARCERGCTFVIKRATVPSTATCPFDGSRVTSVAAPAA